eukprot:4761941-Amphidinium_carterae.2
MNVVHTSAACNMWRLNSRNSMDDFFDDVPSFAACSGFGKAAPASAASSTGVVESGNVRKKPARAAVSKRSAKRVALKRPCTGTVCKKPAGQVSGERKSTQIENPAGAAARKKIDKARVHDLWLCCEANPLRIGVHCAGLAPEGMALENMGVDYEFTFITEKDVQKQAAIRHLYKGQKELDIFDTVEKEILSCVPRDKVDIITGGFPCQPFSGLGRHGGFKDKHDRGIVIFDILKSIRKHDPTLVILENVKGLVHNHWQEFQEMWLREAKN